MLGFPTPSPRHSEALTENIVLRLSPQIASFSTPKECRRGGELSAARGVQVRACRCGPAFPAPPMTKAAAGAPATASWRPAIGSDADDQCMSLGRASALLANADPS